jgi:hypothetical protein
MTMIVVNVHEAKARLSECFVTPDLSIRQYPARSFW